MRTGLANEVVLGQRRERDMNVVLGQAQERRDAIHRVVVRVVAEGSQDAP